MMHKKVLYRLILCLAMLISAGLQSISAAAQSVRLPPPLKSCYDRHHGRPIGLIPDSEIQSCYPLAFSFASSRSWLTPSGFWEYAGYQQSLSYGAFYSNFRLPGNVFECRTVFDGDGSYLAIGREFYRVHRRTFSTSGLARISDPLDRAKHLVDGYQSTKTPCAIGWPGASAADVERQLQRIAGGPQAYQCTPWDRGACGDRKSRSGSFVNVPVPHLQGDLQRARALSYELILKMFQ
jgi:hypothetical protein